MASAPSDPRPIVGRVDRDGVLVAADPELERLQVEAGSRLGASLALPQLAGVVRVAQRLRIPVSRRVLAASKDQDIDMWVRAVPDGEEIALTIDRWAARAAAPPRLAAIAAVEHEKLAAPPFSWSVDDQLRLVTMAPSLAELLSLDAEAVAGQPLTKLFRLEENEEGEMPLLAALATRTGFADQKVTARDGSHRLTLSGEAAEGPDGSFSGFEGSAVVAEEAPATVDAQPIVDSAIHSALRSPLDNIVRSAEEMIGGGSVPTPGEYSDYAADIAAAARHLLSVIHSLGDEVASPEPHQVDLPELASEAVALIESAAKEREIVTAIQPVESLAARGESRSVIQILVNLIGNAVRHSAEGTAVTISFEATNGSAMVHVADEGPGIDPADQERIFEPFQQARKAKEGSGLGLSIARRLARAMGGDIQLQSSPGNGSRFTLVLPAA
ncbi:MAG TPA: HAMP domain-containing sensor histidine kinase [Sphingomicrobium sp.]|nr:HAMP domain-containing sensor histidine kinase [Sphingomicrobium sp.]